MYKFDSVRLQQLRDEFFLNGQSVADWARDHGFRPDVVYAILSGRQKGIRGEGHRIAVALGLKNGANDLGRSRAVNN